MNDRPCPSQVSQHIQTVQSAVDPVLRKRARHRVPLPTPTIRRAKDVPPNQTKRKVAVWEQQDKGLLQGIALIAASSSNPGPGTSQNRSLIPIPVNDDRQFNNADGFAMVFDPAWKECLKRGELENKSVDEKIETVIDHLNDHPFVQSEPTQARQVAQFRVRLLEL